MAYRVLSVDDSPAMRAFVRRVMEISGFETSKCLEADSGEEALELLRSDWVDVILTDINMPGIGGEEFLRKLAEEELLRSIPAVVISTDATQLRMDRLAALCARGYITKPFRPEELREELERVLGAGDD